MIPCRFVGGNFAMVGDREFDTIGQRAVLSEQGFKEAVLGRAAFISEVDFLRCRFTNDELRLHGPFGMRVDPPQSFLDKLALAQQMFRDTLLRIRSEAGQVLAEAAEVDVQESELAVG